jgi:3-methylfumaryl-CoA hydratase
MTDATPKPFAEWIGRTSESQDEVSPRLDASFRAIFAPNLAPVGEGEAPLGVHWCLSPAIAGMAELGPDGHPAKNLSLPPVPQPRRMWAGGEIETHDALRVGDRVRRVSSIRDIARKQGRSGELWFVAVGHDYLTDRGLAIRERHDIVYREAAKVGKNAETSRLSVGERQPPPLTPPHKGEGDVIVGASSGKGSPDHEAAAYQGPPPPCGEGWGVGVLSAASDHQPHDGWLIETSPTLLFRYSAITFNGHRIHYDLPYATEVEGYPGLVVHGPIQATLLYNLAAMQTGKPPKRFSYRGLAPAFSGAPLRVCADPAGGGRFRTEAISGTVHMEAVAEPE